MIFVKVKTAENQPDLQKHVFYPSSPQSLLLRKNISVDIQEDLFYLLFQTVIDEIAIIYPKNRYKCQMLWNVYKKAIGRDTT
jgi:hypothetical protein